MGFLGLQPSQFMVTDETLKTIEVVRQQRIIDSPLPMLQTIQKELVGDAPRLLICQVFHVFLIIPVQKVNKFCQLLR